MFHLDISYSFRVMFWTKFKVLKLTKGNNSKIRTKKSYCSYALHIYPLRSSHLQSFMLISLIVLELCPRQNFSIRGENLKMRLNRVMVLSTALLLTEIYLPTMFHLDISYSFRVMFRIKFKVLKLTKGNNSKIKTKKSYCSYALHIYPLRSIHLQSFMLISLIVLELCPRQNFSIRRDNSKTGQNRVMVL
jgi:hypothetical protein